MGSEFVYFMQPSLLTETRKTLHLAIPMILGALGQLLIGYTDTLMVGRLGTLPLAAIAFANNAINTIFVIGIGIGSAIHVLIAQSLGSQNPKRGSLFLGHGIWLSFFMSLLLFFSVFFGRNLLLLLDQPTSVILLSIPYLVIVTLSLMPAFLGTCLKNYLEAYQNPWLPFKILAIGIVANAFLNWLLIFGHWGFPRLELIGSGFATLIARTLILVLLIAKTTRLFDIKTFFKIRLFPIKRILSIALPSALHILFDWAPFLIMTLMMGWINAESIAAHQIALSYSGLNFVVPLGFSFALTIRIGHAKGIQDWKAAKRIGTSGILTCGLYLLACATIVILTRKNFPLLFSRDPVVISLAGSFLMIDAIFQFFDGLSIASVSSLRGLSDVTFPMLTTFFFNLLPGLCLSYILAFKFHLGGVGLWLGGAISIVFASFILVYRFYAIIKRCFPVRT